MSRLIASLTLIMSLLPLSAAERRVPTVDDLLTIKSIGGPQISPDGTRVVFTQTEADFKQDAFVTQLWLADVKSGGTLQLTRGDKSSNNPQWSGDGKWIAFTSARAGDRNQLFLIDPRGGEAIQITKSETAINSFSWAPDGKTIAYSAPEALTAGQKDRKEQLGDFEVVRREYQHVHLWTVAVDEAMKEPVDAKAADARQGLQRRAVLVGARREDDSVRRHHQSRSDQRQLVRHLHAAARRRRCEEDRVAAGRRHESRSGRRTASRSSSRARWAGSCRSRRSRGWRWCPPTAARRAR